MKHPSYYANELQDIAIDLIHAINQEDSNRVEEILEVVDAIVSDCREAIQYQKEDEKEGQ